MEKKVKMVKYNFRQVGSLTDRDGCGEDYDRLLVGDNCTSITENEPHNGLQQWNYLAEMNDGSFVRIFNPNYVEYSQTYNPCKSN